LPEEFARDADRVVRFPREAKPLASLNHPSIAAIRGLEAKLIAGTEGSPESAFSSPDRKSIGYWAGS